MAAILKDAKQKTKRFMVKIDENPEDVRLEIEYDN